MLGIIGMISLLREIAGRCTAVRIKPVNIHYQIQDNHHLVLILIVAAGIMEIEKEGECHFSLKLCYIIPSSQKWS